MIFLLTAVFTFWGFISLGQENNHFPTFGEIIPPSPTAAEITKYGNYPVSYSTGVPNIDIPVYSYKGINNGLSLDVRFSYHASGIKVKQRASNVGLGWSLFSGGVISRSVNGLMDETPQKGFWEFQLPQNDAIGNSPFERSLRPYNNISAGMYDGQLDEFSFNFNGRSGSFYIGKNNDILFNKTENLHLSWEIGNPNYSGISKCITRFTIIDELGVKYIFDNMEFTTALGPVSTATKNAATSWYLSEIISPNKKDKITFQYESGHIYSYSTGVNLSRGYFENYERTSSGQSATSFQLARLKTITFPNSVKLELGYEGTQRIDLPGDYLLKQIEIIDHKSKRGFNLLHDYSLKKATLTKLTPYSYEGTNKRMEKPYSFEYFTAAGLPEYDSKVDHWGYYLTQEGTGMGEQIPYEVFIGGLPFYPVKFSMPGEIRTTNPYSVKACSIKKVTYPTGGYTLFEFEANQADHPWLRKTAQYTTMSDPWIERSSSCYVNSDDRYKDNYVDISYEGDNNKETIFTLTLNSHTSGDCAGGCSITAELYDSNNPATMVRMSSATIPYTQNGGSVNFSGFNLVKGRKYRVVMYAQGFRSFSSYLGLQWKQPTEPRPVQHEVKDIQEYVGGLRIKSIVSYDGVNPQSQIRKDYQYISDDGKSSGVLGYFPTYTYTLNMGFDMLEHTGGYRYRPDHDSPSGADGYKDVIIRSNSSIYPSVYTSGNLVTYNRVIEQDVANGLEKGKKIMHFLTKPAHIITTFPMTPPQNASYGVGELLREEYLDQENNPVRTVVNSYKVTENNFYTNSIRRGNFESITLLPRKVLIGYAPRPNDSFSPFGEPIYFASSRYLPYAGKVELVGTTETLYSATGPIETRTGSTYHTTELYKLADTLYNSDGVKTVITYKYPNDLKASGNIYDKMVKSHIIYPVIETNFYKTDINNHMQQEKKIYSEPITGMFEVQYVDFFTNGSKKLERYLTFSEYDVYGNPTEVQFLDGPSTVYLWGYGGQYPIAKIEYASMDQVRSALGSSATTILNNLNALNVTDATINQHMKTLRDKLTGARVSSFTYTPLSGMTSMTDPRGITEYYQYDGFQRLKDVLDFEKNVLMNYQYHYRP